MSTLLPRLKQELASLAEAVPGVRPARRATLDLVHLARHSLGEKSREIELLARFDQQAVVAGARLRASQGSAEAEEVARMLSATARIAGAFAVASAADAYVATLAGGASERDRLRALEILEEEIGIARAAIGDLMTR